MAARQHHYLSQCYLKGFTAGGSKNSKLLVFDFNDKKTFETKPRNVGGVRDFNRIDLPDVAPDALETALSAFETNIASAISRVVRGGAFADEDKDYIIHLIALIALRSPQMRENFRRFFADIAQMMVEASLATKERWEGICADAAREGVDLGAGTDYEVLRDFVRGKDYKIDFAREYKIGLEFKGVDSILPFLYARKWLLTRATESSGPFITTDAPVSLTWRHPDEVPVMFRSSPGHGMKDTLLYFPLSKDVALIGEFDGRDGEVNASKRLVTMLNTRALMHFHKQVYAPGLGFNFLAKDGELADGKRLMRELG